jgi:glutathione S-transferase
MLTLVIGNKAYSSWSLRPWVFLRHHGIAFEEVRVALYAGDYKSRITAYSPAGKVPVLVDGDLTVWDSLAILEYLCEKFPHLQGWPQDAAVRARARSACAEMHSGFGNLRQHLTMNARRVFPWREWPAEVMADIARIETLWAECRRRHGTGGPFLFGAFSAADAMYAPVVWRLHGYSVPVSAVTRAYLDAMLALPAMRDWQAGAFAEAEVLPQFERDTP